MANPSRPGEGGENMKIQLDTENKTIKLESSVEMSKLIDTLNKLFPNKEWKKFTLETNTTIAHWSSPIVIERYHQPYYPWYYVVSASSKSADYSVKAGNTNLAMNAGVVGNNNALSSLKAGIFNVEA